METKYDLQSGSLDKQGGLAAVQACLQQQVLQLQQLAPQALAEDAVRLELLAQLQESLSNARALIDLVAEQQRLTGQDPLGAAAYKAALQANAVEEEAIEADLEAYEADPDSEVEELSEASRMLLLQVLGVVDTLDRSQAAGLAQVAKCHPHQVRSLFSDLRNKLRNTTAAAAKRASKAAAAEAAAAADAAAAGSAGNTSIKPQEHAAPVQRGYYHQPTTYMQQHSEGPVGSHEAAAAAAAAAGEAQPAAVGSGPKLGPTCARLAGSIAAQKERLGKALDQETGVIKDGGRFIAALASMSSWAGRSAALAALAASYSIRPASAVHISGSGSGGRSGATSSKGRGSFAAGRGAAAGASTVVRRQMEQNSRLLEVLEAWLGQARREKQIGILRQLLLVLPHINSNAGLMQQSSSLAAQVAALHSHPHGAVAAAARAVTAAWAPGGAGGLGRQYSGQQQQQYAVPGGLVQCGGAHKVTSGYKRKTTLAIKRQLEELELVGDLKRRPGTAAGPTAAAAAAAEGAKQQPSAAGAGAAAGKQPVPASAAGPVAAKLGAASGSFKRPSKRVAQPAAAAANGTASQAQGQATQQQASRRLAALHALSGRPAGQQQQQQQKSVEQLWAELPQQQRLHAMAPHGRAPATFLAAAGAFAAEVTQAVQAHDRAVQHWMQQRCQAAAREQAAADAALVVLQQGRLNSSWLQRTADASTPGWAAPPPAVPAGCFEGIPGGWAAGQDSQIAPTAAEDWPQRFSALRQQQQEQQQGGVPLPEPLEPQEAAAGEAGAGALPAAAGSAGVVRRVPLHPVDESEALKERVTLWLAGVRLPSQITRPPSTADIARVRQQQFSQQYPQQQQQQQQQQLQPQQLIQEHQQPVSTGVVYHHHQQQPPPQVQYYHAAQHVQQQPVYQQQQQQQPQQQQPAYQQEQYPQWHQAQVQQQHQHQQPAQYYPPPPQQVQNVQPQVVYLQQQHQHQPHQEQLVLQPMPGGYVPGQPPQQQTMVYVVHGQQQPQPVLQVVQQPQSRPVQPDPEPYQQGYFPQGY